MDWVLDICGWLLDRLPAVLLIVLVAVIVLVAYASCQSDRQRNREYQQLLDGARTREESLTVKLEWMRAMHSSSNTTVVPIVVPSR